MKKPITHLLLVIFLLSLKLNAQDCQECKTRSIVIFDNQNLVPRPEGPDSVLANAVPKWWDLFFISGGENSYFSEDPTKSCFMKLCAAFYVVKDTVLTSIKRGVEHPNTAPSGSIGGNADYILTGTISGAEPNYTLNLNFEAAKTREVVKSASVNFSAGFDPFTVGKDAASQLGPFYTTIMDFERQKRDEGEPYAINPRIDVKPEKKELKTNESTEVEFIVTDCDGVVIKNRKIDLSTVTLGKFDKTEVTTDDQGKAKATFTAGDQKGTASIYPKLEYQRAYSDVKYLADGEGAFINIEEPPNWLVEGTYEFIKSTTIEGSQPYTRSRSDAYDNEDLKFSAVVKVKELFGTFYSDTPPAAMLTNGSAKYSYKYDLQMSTSEGSIRRDIKNECSGNSSILSGEVALVFGSDGKEISFGVPIDVLGGGYEYSKTCSPQGCEDFNADNDCSISSPAYLSFDLYAENITSPIDEVTTFAGFTETKKGLLVKTIEQNNNTYKFVHAESYIVTKETKMGEFSEYERSSTEIFFEVSVTTYGLTGIGIDVAPVKDYILYQNYPNPFNPSTTISFSIPSAGFVSLKVYDVLGNEVATLVNEEKTAGRYDIKFNPQALGKDITSGIYFYQLKAGDYTDSKKLVLMK